MASILFDDITFPRELYDPDTFEFVPPVSTLLTFTPHILSQLAKDAAEKQEPIPCPPPTETVAPDVNSTSSSPTETQNTTSKDMPIPPSSSVPPSSSNPSSSNSSSSPSSSQGLFATLRGLATHQSTHKLLENGIFLAGRYMDGSASASHPVDSRQQSAHESQGWFGTRGGTDNFSYSYREQERQRLLDMEKRLRQMDQDMRQNATLARAEIDSQRRDRYKLEQELEAQKAKVKQLEKAMAEQQRQQEAHQSQQSSKTGNSKNKDSNVNSQKASSANKNDQPSQDSEEDADSSAESSEKQALLKKDASMDPASNTALMATVGVVSLVLSLYSAHKASSTYSVVSFHDQLRALMEQCESVVQSTEAWISEQFLDVPDQIREDLKLIRELMDIIHRIDPRSEKKAEALAWSMSAVGSLGAVGGAFLGSMTAMASGGTVVIGCALYGIISRARFNGPEYGATKTMMEVRATQILRSLGVDSASTPASPTRTTGKSPAYIIHENRIERLRIEFERRDGHDLRDADEIDGLEVEDALRESSFSAPFVSTRKRMEQLHNPL